MGFTPTDNAARSTRSSYTQRGGFKEVPEKRKSRKR